MINAYLNFGGPGTVDGDNGTRLTVNAPCKETSTPHFYSATGYGHAIPTRYLVFWAGRWRRVYACCYGNGAVLFIGTTRKSDLWLATVDIWRE